MARRKKEEISTKEAIEKAIENEVEETETDVEVEENGESEKAFNKVPGKYRKFQ